MKAKSIVIIAILLLAVVGAYFGLSSLSIIGNDTIETYPGSTCSVADDCYDYFLSIGFPQDKLDEQLTTLQFVCENKVCGVASK